MFNLSHHKFTSRNRAFVFILTLMLTLIMTFGLTSAQETNEEPSLAYEQDPTVANDWMFLLYELIREAEIDAPSAARLFGYAGVAFYESVVPGMPENFSVGGQLAGLPMLPFPEEGEMLDWQSSANGALATLLEGFFVDEQDRILDLKNQWIETRSADVNPALVERSVAYGEEIGAMILQWSTTDNAAVSAKAGNDYEPPTGDPSLWVETTPGQPLVQPYWGEVRPFGMGFPEQCNVPLRLEYSDDPGSTFYKQAAEVLETSDNLTDEQRQIARFWVDTPGITGTPAGHWVLIVSQLIEQYDLDLARAAETYMLVNTALADSFISAWNMKYRVNLLRPVTYIQRNLRRNWAPYVESPTFPEYPSGHSVTSAAAAEVLTTMYGQIAFDDRTPILNGHENLQRSFTSVWSAASEAAISRMYGGIHFRAAIENGMAQGRCVGQSVLNNIRLRSIPQGE